eukprot:CAMPEP_0170407522 /NCGR_PEP_ID=MMETSP0117_2-20130122/28292_1 /TAXON_ID=400756 /ORGANISM="Durinskia baltica, Strain CSIRO CS-38" /LENGTH=111 /DNA_ID=CAMNT_0010664775 /DNA_START=76 /DNA_END=411 /DNA_ORIENTATION=+
MTESRKSVDDIHDLIDSLELSVFEAMRKVANEGANVNDSADIVKEIYSSVCSAVDNLSGINRTHAEQLAILQELSKKYEATRNSVLELEGKLLETKHEVDKRLESSCSKKQ